MGNTNRTIRSIIKTIDNLSRITGKAISYILLITILVTIIEVVSRYIFNNPTTWSYEVEMFTCGILYVIVGAYVQLEKTHVGVDLVSQLAGTKTQRILRLTVNFPLILIFSAGLTYMGAEYAWTSVKMWERSYTSWAPFIWPVKLMLPVGSFLLLLQAIADFLRDLFQVEGDTQ
ncbi:TRAP transporter small permease subunit [Desulfotignum balticum]|uniref:TRAP transporter small permease subunit n=1 Tax=Desulfotignum balticum TaxID=115781 RepID=UPI000462927D|nr:TRAP transporter small permease subunit [Desulfotignum balticum]